MLLGGGVLAHPVWGPGLCPHSHTAMMTANNRALAKSSGGNAAGSLVSPAPLLL